MVNVTHSNPVTPENMQSCVLWGNIMHSRIFPKRNTFTYGIYYVALSIKDITTARQNTSKTIANGLNFNRWGLTSFYEKDFGNCDGTDLEQWCRGILKSYKIDDMVDSILLFSMPRVLGYTFNPVSFWVCSDTQGNVIAVVCEVHNTFGERHTYICKKDDNSPIGKKDWMYAEKTFHVSPFLPRNGSYKFRFDITEKTMGFWIDYYDSEGKKQLLTCLTGTRKPLDKKHLRQGFLKYPLVAMRAVYLIHYQALKLWWKKIQFHKKPSPNQNKITLAESDIHKKL